MYLLALAILGLIYLMSHNHHLPATLYIYLIVTRHDCSQYIYMYIYIYVWAKSNDPISSIARACKGKILQQYLEIMRDLEKPEVAKNQLIRNGTTIQSHRPSRKLNWNTQPVSPTVRRLSVPSTSRLTKLSSSSFFRAGLENCFALVERKYWF